MGRIVVAVGAVIEDEGKILLVEHVPWDGDFWGGKWICPGGGLELGESITEGILREVKEETDLAVELVSPLIPFERIVKRNGETVLHVIYIDYMARRVGGELKPDSDVGRAVWVKKEEIASVWPNLHDDTKRLLQIANLA